MTIGRLELYYVPFGFYKTKTHCGCYMCEIGWLGFTWLSNDCMRRRDDSI